MYSSYRAPVYRSDEELLRQISPVQVAAYLRASGWQEARLVSEGASAVWTRLPDARSGVHSDRGADDDYEVLLPLRTEYRDFVRRMSELFDTLQEAEQRPLDAILDSLAEATADIVELGVVGEKVNDGTIPFADSVRLNQRFWDLLQAAACAAAAGTPRAAY